jgi:hypothetical protein
MSELSWHQMRAAGMHSLPYDIAGYTYNADNYCERHVFGAMGKRRLPGRTVEESLDTYAAQRGIDRQDERSFDSGDFPKVIFRDQAHDGCNAANDYEPGQCGDRCGKCGEPLDGSCPNIPED